MNIFQEIKSRLTGQPTLNRAPIRVLVLDDDDERHDWFARRFYHDQIDVAHDVETARELLQQHSYDAIFLDHDLLPEHYNAKKTDDERTGYAVAAALAEDSKPHISSTVIVHSLNADGAHRMVRLLHGAGFAVEYIPFPMLEHRLRKYWQ